MDPSSLLTHGLAAAVGGSVTGLSFGTTSNPNVGAATTYAGTVVTTSDPWAYTSGNGQTKIESTQVQIDINMASWNSASTVWQAQTIIHELGHAFNMLLGAGGSDFVYDALPNGSPDPAAEAKNAQTMQDCIHN